MDIFDQKSSVIESNSIFVKSNNLSLELEDSICGKKGEVINVPLRVWNFKNIKSFQFTVFITDSTVGKIISITKGDINGEVQISFQDVTTVGIRWNHSNPVSVSDSFIIANISIRLENSNKIAQIHINNHFSDIIILNAEGKSLFPDLKSGKICIDSKLISKVNSIRSNDESKLKLVSYPNPTTGQIKIVGLDNFEIMEIYTSTGAALGIRTTSSLESSVDLSKYPPGLYRFKIKQKRETVMFKYITLLKI